MNVLRSGIVTMLLLAAFSVSGGLSWPAWSSLKRMPHHKGRVIFPSDARKSPPPKGEARAVFCHGAHRPCSCRCLST
ncbi:glycosyl hydrolase family 8 [Shigella flexneri]